MRILFIKLRHIGDALLLTPTIVATKQKFPQAEIWVLVRKSCEGMLVGCPEIDRIVCTARPERHKRQLRGALDELALARLLRTTRFDYVFELGDNDRGRWLALLARTPNRCTNSHRSLRRIWRPAFHKISKKKRWPMHQVERDFVCPSDFLELPEPPPALRFAPERMEGWAPADGFESYAVIHAPTRWPSKAWPLDRWRELAARLLTLIPHLVISCGPDPDEVRAARELCSGLGDQVVSTEGKVSWSQLAWILSRARFFVGVDTAAMHLAAAVNCPVVCLFGPSGDFEFHPWAVKYWMIRPHDWTEPGIIEKTPREGLMNLIPVSRVFEACREAATFCRKGT